MPGNRRQVVGTCPCVAENIADWQHKRFEDVLHATRDSTTVAFIWKGCPVVWMYWDDRITGQYG